MNFLLILITRDGTAARQQHKQYYFTVQIGTFSDNLVMMRCQKPSDIFLTERNRTVSFVWYSKNCHSP